MTSSAPLKYRLPPFRPLAKTEPIPSSTSLTTNTWCSSIATKHAKNCPCGCNLALTEYSTLNEPSPVGRSLVDSLDEEESEGLFGVLHAGVAYETKKVLTEGWLHKKGTGKDIFGTRAWKPRYCRLVLAQVEGYHADVPLLMVYWYDTSEKPSNVICLTNSVVMSVDCDGDDHHHSFNIIHAKKGQDRRETTRSFTNLSSKTSRNEWVFLINQALLEYEKQRSSKPTASTARPVPEDYFRRRIVPKAPSPSGSTTSTSKRPARPAPRHEVLVGESFVR